MIYVNYEMKLIASVAITGSAIIFL